MALRAGQHEDRREGDDMSMQTDWEAFAKLQGLNPNTKGHFYMAFTAGWKAGMNDAKKTVKEGEEWKLLDNDQA
jgi:hypothetical protein